ncbi:hypothetical protein ONZ45_g12146 [Pleurotus djamor]|nr:hypothetical protein ONZ45_g12146 [Pleurotus djamor]
MHSHSPPSQRARHRNDYPDAYYQDYPGPPPTSTSMSTSGPGGVYTVVSRDGTPVSVGEDRDSSRPSRPDSRSAQGQVQGQYYEQDQQQQQRSFRLRPVTTGPGTGPGTNNNSNNNNREELDFVHEDGRGRSSAPGPGQGGDPTGEGSGRGNSSRKRGRYDDGESDVVDVSGGSSGSYNGSGARVLEERERDGREGMRGGKRYHRERDEES